MRSLSIFAVPLLLWAAVAPARAQVTRTLHHGVQDFLAGDLDGLAIDNLGQLASAPVALERYPSGSLYAWTVGLDRKGRVWVGTGERGGVARLNGDQFEVVAHTLALQVLTLMPFGDVMLAGSSPDGVVYAITDDGEVQVALDVPQQSIWDLEVGSREGTWLAGTGPGARLVRAGKGSEAGEILHELAATNLTVILRDERGLWLGTQGPGMVLRIEGDDTEAPVLRMATEEEEVVALTSDGDGGVFVLSVDMGSGNDQSGRSRLTWLLDDGSRETIWEGDHRLISLAQLADGSFLAGEAESGRVFRLDRQGRLSLWAELEGGDPLWILPDGDTTWVATGNLGDVFALRSTKGGTGTFESAVVETPHVARWGRLWVDGWGRKVEVSARAGERRSPDETWSAWSDWAPAGAVIDAPLAPYLQYRLRLEDGTVTTVHLAYAERNLAPKVTKLTVEPAGRDFFMGGGMGNGGMPVSQQFDDGLQVEFSVGSQTTRVEPEDAAYVRGLRSIVFEASDENGDELIFRVEARRLPDGAWFPLVDDLVDQVWAWDTRAVEDGTYRLRVTAYDHVEEGREGALTSAPVRVDNTSPRVARTKVGDDRVVLVVEDAGSTLREIHVRNFVTEDWQPVAPVDGVIDAPVEEIALDLPAEGEGLWLRLVDAAGNVLVTAPRLED